jgi:ribosomal protein L35
MPKIKTNKAVAKRFIKKKSKAKGVHVMKRATGQDHFNSRESGNTTRRKRRDRAMGKTELKTIKQLTPYT